MNETTMFSSSCSFKNKVSYRKFFSDPLDEQNGTVYSPASNATVDGATTAAVEEQQKEYGRFRMDSCRETIGG